MSRLKTPPRLRVPRVKRTWGTRLRALFAFGDVEPAFAGGKGDLANKKAQDGGRRAPKAGKRKTGLKPGRVK